MFAYLTSLIDYRPYYIFALLLFIIVVQAAIIAILIAKLKRK